MKKKVLPIIIVTALASAGCIKDNSFDNPCRTIEATIDGNVDATRAILIDNPGVRLESRWQGGESIGVFGGSAANVRFSVKDGDISTDGKTAKFNSDSDIPGGALTAYSPYQEGASASGDAITLQFPAVQTYSLYNGVPQPDPQSNIMVATGSSNTGLTFRNAMAALKIGQVFDERTVVKSVEFRDLSGAPVCGAMSLSWNGGAPTATVTGTGSVITLDCGEGVTLAAGQPGIFFITVPAREYAKGIEITFIDDGGKKTVKTAGAAKGKTLARSVVYLIGDVSSREPIPGTTCTLKPEAQIMTPEKLDKVTVIDANMYYVEYEGERVKTLNGTDLRMPHLDMLMHKDLQPEVGHWLIFDEPTAELPSGGVYKIVTCNKQTEDYYEVVAYPEPDVAAPFEDMKAGDPLVDDSGNLVEGGGLPIDITSYITSIIDESGKYVDFSISPEGNILLGEDTVAEMMGLETRSIKEVKFTSPRLSLNSKSSHMEVSIGGTLSLNTRIAVRYMQGSLQYMQFTVTPEVQVSLNTVLKAEGNAERSARLYTINVLPVPVAPGVLVVPQIVLSAKVGVGGALQVSGSFSATQKLGTYSLAYNKGDGNTLRWLRPAIDNPTEFNMDFGGIEGSLKVYGGIGVSTNITLYGMCGLGLENYLTLNLGTAVNSNGSLKLFLQPEFEVTPSLCFAFGSKKFEDFTGKAEFDPMWERYIRPKSSATVITRFNWSEYKDIEMVDGSMISSPVQTSVRGIEYKITLEGECADDIKVVLLTYLGDSVQYIPDINDPLGSEFNKFRDSGVAHLYTLFNLCDKKLVNPGKKPHEVISVGTYPADTDKMVFEGEGRGTFIQGQAYGVVPAIIVGEQTWIIDSGGQSDYYHPFIFWWPNRSNGQPYMESDRQ